MPHQLLEQLRQRLPHLPAAQAKVVTCILENPQAAVNTTVEQLAQQARVSMPTIVRTCRLFGFQSVREFMVALAQNMAVTGSYLHRTVQPEDDAQAICSKIIHAAVGSLTELGRNLDATRIDEVAHCLAQASRIDCYAVGAGSHFMTQELQSRLFRLGRHANAMFDAHQQLISASTLGPTGVAFVISHVGRMPYTLEAARLARTQGSTVVALTQPDTPLAACAHLVLPVSVPPDAVMRVGTEAYLAHLLVIEILMVRLAQKMPPQITQNLQQAKPILDQYGFDSSEYSGFAAPQSTSSS